MEADRMKPKLTALAACLLAVTAQAGEVFKTTDSEGRTIYTDRPQTLPAERLDVRTSTTDTVEVARRYDEQKKQYAEADKARTDAVQKATDAKKTEELTAEDRAKRCVESRERYESMMNARRLFEPGSTEGERRYLSSEEIDAARANAKQTMDEFCTGQ
ncbi:MAG: DUF4124 domain-containing protein [Lysobacterales bacterium]|jgi:hypothetical protein|nr:MAG: DUF4124 domain-containing protein [Xanthomonadales bacterium]